MTSHRGTENTFISIGREAESMGRKGAGRLEIWWGKDEELLF